MHDQQLARVETRPGSKQALGNLEPMEMFLTGLCISLCIFLKLANPMFKMMCFIVYE